jgi:polysaccharide deacetylase family protein (PEP-CTERM system associated)
MKKKRLILSFDLEFWYNSEFIKNYIPKGIESFDDKTIESTIPLLKILKRFNTKATFFVLGKVAEKYPDLIRQIANDGHEIASHGYSHKTLNDLTPIEFEEEIKKSVRLLEKINGVKPIGFRAPNFSLNNKTKWALKILERNGFKYDSSIFPFKTPLYGDSKAPLEIYKISKNITEFPIAVYQKAALRIPIAGGFYFRLIPLSIYQTILVSIQKKRDAVIYLHPHELYNFIPNLKIPWWKKKLKYWGVNNSLVKFEELLKKFELISINNYFLKH